MLEEEFKYSLQYNAYQEVMDSKKQKKTKKTAVLQPASKPQQQAPPAKSEPVPPLKLPIKNNVLKEMPIAPPTLQQKKVSPPFKEKLEAPAPAEDIRKKGPEPPAPNPAPVDDEPDPMPQKSKANRKSKL